MEAINIYKYGSKVYGTNPNGDNDLIVIVNKDYYYDQFCSNILDISFYGFKTFEQSIKQHEIFALECLFLSSENILLEKHHFDFELDLQKLRTSISKTSSNSFVKAKKKINKEKDYYIGQKSLFHSLRILMFGIQIARNGKIIDYSEANNIWFDIVNSCNCTWDLYFKKYKPLYNKLSTEFKIVAPKSITDKNQ